MRKTSLLCCLVASALLAANDVALAQRGQGGGQGQGGAQGQGQGQGGGQGQGKANPASPSKPSADQTKEKEQARAKSRAATDELRKNPKLAESMSDLLPGQNLETASSGFRNVGQFMAAAQVSKNTGIPFAELKARMVDRDMSLGQAIKDARPELDAPAEARKAEVAARERMAKAQ